MTINPFELDPGPMSKKLQECLEMARQSDGTDFILACGVGGMGATGLGDIPSDDEAEEGSDTDMQADEQMEEEDGDDLDPYDAPVPMHITTLPKMEWCDLDCGSMNGGCVSTCGSAFVWGTNDHGNLGVCNTKVSTAFDPLKAEFPEKVCIRKISMGGAHTAMCDAKGQVWTAGTFKSDGPVGHHYDTKTGHVVENQTSFMKLTEYSNLSVVKMRDKDRTLPPIVDVQSGVDHFLMLDDDGRIWEMGVTVMGQRCSKRNQKKYLIPRMSPMVGRNEFLRFSKIRCGSHFSLAITKNTGELYTWGQNIWMQCGHPLPNHAPPGEALESHEAVIDLPTKVHFPEPTKIVDASAGEHFAIALDSRGRVFSWGRNASNTLGRPTETPPKKGNQTFENEALPDLPKQVNLPPIAKIAAGPAHWFALTKSGKVHAFGANMDYRTGFGENEKFANGETVFDKRNLKNDFEVINIAGGSMHSLFHLRKTLRSGSKQKRRMNDDFFAPATKLPKN